MKRLLKVLKDYDRVLVHKNSFFDHDFLLYRHEVFVQTTDLRFTKGRFDDVDNVDVVVYVSDSHEPLALSATLLSSYCDSKPVVYIGDKRGGKRLLKQFKTVKRFYEGDKVVGVVLDSLQEFNVKEYEYSCEINDLEFVFKTSQGLFSYRDLDVGTKFLLENLPKLKGKILDFGCGVGVIGIYLAKQGLDVSLVDSNLRSLEYSKKNAKLNDVNVKIQPSYLARNVKGRFDYVVSNPPTHMRLEEAEELLSDLSKVCEKVLFVINNIVNYERVGKKYFDTVSVIASNDKFKIIEFAHQHSL